MLAPDAVEGGGEVLEAFRLLPGLGLQAEELEAGEAGLQEREDAGLVCGVGFGG